MMMPSCIRRLTRDVASSNLRQQKYRARIIRLSVLIVTLGGTPLQAQQWTIASSPLLTVADDLGQIVTATTLGTGTIVVADASNKRLVYYTPQGRRIRISGRGGAGPGEFQSVHWMGRCGGDTLAVVDPILNRLTYVDRSGNLLMTRPAKTPWVQGYATDNRATPYDMVCGATGAWVTVGWPLGAIPTTPGAHRESVNIAVAPARGGFRRVGTFAGPERVRYPASDGPMVFGKKVVVAVSATRVYVGTADSFFVESYDLKGRRLANIQRTGKAKPLRKVDFDSLKTEYKRRNPAYASRVDVVVEKGVYPKNVPAYDRFLIDDQNRLWIQEGARPADTARVWYGFTERGISVGQLRVPGKFDVYEIRGSDVLGKWVDEEGRESVRRYRLQRSTQ